MSRPRALSVLIVEDDPDGAASLAQLLSLHGHETRVALNGDEAVGAAAGFPADVVILDIGLPGADGYAVARMLCGGLERRPLLIAVTGHPNMEGQSRAEGFDYHFEKPVHPHVLTDLLERYAARIAAVDG